MIQYVPVSYAWLAFICGITLGCLVGVFCAYLAAKQVFKELRP